MGLRTCLQPPSGCTEPAGARRCGSRAPRSWPAATAVPVLLGSAGSFTPEPQTRARLGSRFPPQGGHSHLCLPTLASMMEGTGGPSNPDSIQASCWAQMRCGCRSLHPPHLQGNAELPIHCLKYLAIPSHRAGMRSVHGRDAPWGGGGALRSVVAGSPSLGVLLSWAVTGKAQGQPSSPGSDTVVPRLPSGLQEAGLAAAPSASGSPRASGWQVHGLCPPTPQPCLALDHWILSKDQLKDSLSLESLDFSSTGSFPPTAGVAALGKERGAVLAPCHSLRDGLLDTSSKCGFHMFLQHLSDLIILIRQQLCRSIRQNIPKPTGSATFSLREGSFMAPGGGQAFIPSPGLCLPPSIPPGHTAGMAPSLPWPSSC